MSRKKGSKKGWGVVVAILLIIGLIGSCGDTENTSSDFSSAIDSSVVMSEVEEAASQELTSSEETTTQEVINSKETTTSKEVTSSKATSSKKEPSAQKVGSGKATPVSLSDIPSYSSAAYVTINDNIPNFSSKELTTKGYEQYSSLDSLGRCGVAIASCGQEIMPADGEERGSISSIKPSGWVQAKYKGVSGGYLWNRCHLIGWQLSAENANARNLITGTRYMNINGMLPFENMVADYIDETNNHVAYRITPIYKGNNLVASGVQMEAYSIEDKGEGICFNVYCYNVQPGIQINYKTGESSGPSASDTSSKTVSSKSEAPSSSTETVTTPSSDTVYTTATGKKYHASEHCRGLSNANNIYETSLSDAQAQGLGPCGWCY